MSRSLVTKMGQRYVEVANRVGNKAPLDHSGFAPWILTRESSVHSVMSLILPISYKYSDSD